MNSEIRTAISIFSSIILVFSILPYIVNVIKRRTKPRIISWAIWALLNAISAAVAFSDGQYATAAFSATMFLLDGAVAVIGWEDGNRQITLMGKICLGGSLVGIIMWLLLDSPELAIIVSIVVNFIACIPTIVHAWQKPKEETWSAFLISDFASILTLIIATEWSITSIAFPLYFTIMNLFISIVIITRLKQRKRSVFKRFFSR